MIAPIWPTQPWFPLLVSMSIRRQIQIPADEPQQHPLIEQGSLNLSAWRSLSAAGVSEDISKLILASWRKSKEDAYSSCWRRWEQWCSECGLEAIQSPLSSILEFLTQEFQQGKQYRTINCYRSAISMTHAPCDSVAIGKHPLISRLMTGIYNNRHPKARYSFT